MDMVKYSLEFAGDIGTCAVCVCVCTCTTLQIKEER